MRTNRDHKKTHSISVMMLCIIVGLMLGLFIKTKYHEILYDQELADSIAVNSIVMTLPDSTMLLVEDEIIIYLLCIETSEIQFSQDDKIKFYTSLQAVQEWHPVLDIYLMLALAKVESNFDTTAISRKQATGLYQIMPHSANYYSSIVNLPWYDGDLFNVQTNTLMAATILIILYTQYNNIESTLSAYNGNRPIPTQFSKKVLSQREKYILATKKYIYENKINPTEFHNV